MILKSTIYSEGWSDNVHISIADARQLAETFLAKGGIAPADAAIIADILLEAEFRGRKTHGFIRLTGIKSRANGIHLEDTLVNQLTY